jgi:hypothetical protein
MKARFITLFLLFPLLYAYSQNHLTPYEKNKLTSTTYEECIAYYKKLAEQSDIIKILDYGETDIGKPLHLVVVSKDKIFDPGEIHKSGKVILFVNNGIHPGEPDGIDASMMLVRDLVKHTVRNVHENILSRLDGLIYEDPLDRVVLITIPIYNIDGAMNRNNFTRANQVGPLEYGFRANSENRDLNRDFIKCDTKNATAFIKIFREWKPELFVDTHTSDGADYQYIMTYIATQHNKLQQPLADYLTNKLVPVLENDMKNKNFPICPYVTEMKSTPDSGIVEFMESPRYSTGYAALFNTIGIVSETHSLKTHQQRVEAQYELLVSILKAANQDYKTILSNKKTADENSKNKSDFVLSWQLDSANYTRYLFKGYEAKYKQSNVTRFDRLYYDRNASYEKEINFYNQYKHVVTVAKPIAYIIPQGWWRVIDLLNLNKIRMSRLSKDQSIEVQSYYVDTFSTRIPPFESHYLHFNTTLNKITQNRKFFAGDYVVFTDQPENNFIVHVLEPQSTDSYFSWNFFDAILQQKESYDSYIFEDLADSLLKINPELRKAFEDKKASDENFRSNSNAQLDFIYNHTLLEPEYMRYPIARLEKNIVFDLK